MGSTLKILVSEGATNLLYTDYVQYKWYLQSIKESILKDMLLELVLLMVIGTGGWRVKQEERRSR